MTDIVILTDQKNSHQYDKNGKVLNGYLEDAILKTALESEGMSVKRLTWDNFDFDWSTTKAVLFRSTWDYFYRFSEFTTRLSKVSKQTKLINSLATINWNIDKHYLLDLKDKGIHIAESYYIEQGSSTTLHELYDTLGLNETVLKPCVSGTARHTYKITLENLVEHEVVLKELLEYEAMMLQPFQYDIVSKGEVSMVLFNGQYSHSVLKTAKPNEFRVQTDFGGHVTAYQPTPNEITFAQHAVRCCPELPAYARVDIFNDNQGKIALAELELIEPELWFRLFPETANTFSKSLNKI